MSFIDGDRLGLAAWTRQQEEIRRQLQMVEGLEKAALPSDPTVVVAPVPGFDALGTKLGLLVTEKNRQYGDSASKSGAIMRILYKTGIAPHQMDDALLTVRVLDKLSRIAERGSDGKDLGGETPWKDISGYGLLGWRKDGGA